MAIAISPDFKAERDRAKQISGSETPVWGIISWAGANPQVAANNITVGNWRGGTKHRTNPNVGDAVLAYDLRPPGRVDSIGRMSHHRW